MKAASLKILLAAASLATAATAQDDAARAPIREAVLKTRSDIERDTEKLIKLRAEIDAKRKPLARRLEILEKRIAEKRTKLDRLRRIRETVEESQTNLAAKTERLEDECRFILTVFSEYRRAVKTRMNSAEAQTLAPRLREIDPYLTEENNFEDLTQGIEKLLDLAAEWNSRRLGGTVLEGTALDNQGIEHTGEFADFGPVAYFAAGENGPAGLAVTRAGTAEPAIYSNFNESVAPAIRHAVSGKYALLPVDVTHGDALKIKEARGSFTEHVRKGGFVMIPLAIVGFLAAILAIWKAVDLSRLQIRGGDTVRQVVNTLHSGDTTAAEKQAVELREPLESLVREGIKHYDSPREHLEEILHEHVLSVLPRLERHLGALAVFGGVAPLLGLLGTVTGMIHTFRLVTIFGTGDAKLLSGGISEALVTTEFGLAIAIPVLLVHAYFARRVRGIVGALEQTALGMVNDLKVRREDK